LEKVIVGGSDSYDTEQLKEFFEEGFRRIGLDVAHRAILVKPNLLSGKSPERAVTTHPLFLRALIETLKDNSCAVFLGDSPGFEPLERVLKNGGYTKMLRDLGVGITPFDQEIVKRTEGISPYREFLFGQDPARYDLVINAPKLKTHGMMGMTLGVKNTFGFIRGFAKGRWHLRAGRDRDLFASIIVDIHRIASPAVTILDGVLGMCGDGPSSGDAITCGIVGLSRSAFALDAFIEGHLCPGAVLPVTSCAARHGLIPEYEVIDLGLPPPPVSFPMPRACATDWSLPRPVKKLLRTILVRKPKADKSACRLCGICAKVCPAGAIHLGEKSPVFNYSACIRCYCCQEMCPHEAIRV
jgi:uncharacterized protein (DUF362 family)/Pyruvate/2-oxoacid:ferredoxin oxidoreductase delta subunit